MVIPGAIRQLARRPWGRAILCAGVESFDRTVCTAAGVRRQSAKPEPASGRRFSVAIAHYNRGALIHRPLYNLLDHPAVAEVVIVDDGSDAAQFAALERSVAGLSGGGRVRLHRRKENLGALATKGEAVGLASSDWVLVLDSDNTVFRHYLDAFAVIADPSPDTFYCSAWAFPFFNFQALDGLRLDLAACGETTRSGLLRRTYIINDGNYFVPRERYVATVNSLNRTGRDGADVMLVNYRWMTCGGAMEIIPGTAYIHRLDIASLYKTTEEKSRGRILDMFSRFERNLPCDEGYLAELRSGSGQPMLSG